MRRGLAALMALLLFAAAGLCVRTWGFGLTRIAGTSMNATLRDGDVVLVTRFDYLGGGTPSFGDVVECRFPNRRDTYVKRVAGLPGEAVAISGGALYRDGQRMSEPYVSSFAEDFETVLNSEQFLLLGDNRADSYDSRMPDMGPVDAGAFLGRARLVVWPLQHFGIVR
ncbi:MAG: signal peptidase I [Clostridia bacterium]|nr:signal peptidase I [Clostridia bacterium]